MAQADEPLWGQGLKWVWDNWDQIAKRLKALAQWFRGKKKRGILMLGAGGTGKTTLAGILAQQPTFRVEAFRAYQESIIVERYLLKDDQAVEIVVPPGQKHRRDATWRDLEHDLAAGAFRGVIVVGSYGFHSLGISYRDHQLYRGNKTRFFADFCRERRNEEVAILRRLTPFLSACRQKLWILSVATKQDLWWKKRGKVEQFYRGRAANS